VIWSETPPTKSGWYWVKSRGSDQVWIAERTRGGVWDHVSGEYPTDSKASELILFGPPIPSPEQCHEIAKGQS